MPKIAALLAFLALVGLACGGTAADPTAVPTAAPIPMATDSAATPAPPPTPALQLPDAPVSLSRVKAEFGQPLSSGISLPDMVENALLSVVEIRTTLGGGTGFIVNSDGLVVTNRHVVEGSGSARVQLTTGANHTAQVVDQHDTLDLAYLDIDASTEFTPIAVGDSDDVRVGESVIVIGFPIADQLGAEPTVSQGIVSARREGLIQTDAPVNPGNSGGPMLDQFGNVVGVVVSRVDQSGGRDISGIGFAIPVNEVKADLGGDVTPGAALPTPAPTPRPTIPPTIDLEATKAAMSEEDAFLQTKEAAEYQAEEARQEAERYAAELEATRIANRPTATPTPPPTATPTPTSTPPPTATPTPTPTPTPPPTPTPLPTATPHPQVYCQEWEALVLDWIREGNRYAYNRERDPEIPDHPNLSADKAHGFCIIAFPHGWLHMSDSTVYQVGTGSKELLPGTYRYIAPQGGDRFNAQQRCYLTLNQGTNEWSTVDLTYGEPFEFTFHSYHGKVQVWCGFHDGWLVRVGD